MPSMPIGPTPLSRTDRLALVNRIADRTRARYGEGVALGVYGSVGRGTDAYYSDIDMLCVVDALATPVRHEWIGGPWKAQVDVTGREPLLTEACRVSSDWPITHGGYFEIRPLHDPQGFFPQLREAVLSPPAPRFVEAIRQWIVDDVFELVGKFRNAVQGRATHYLPMLAVALARSGACLVGLDARHLYSTGSMVLPESLGLPSRPSGYDALCAMVMSGELSEADRVASACEAFWAGVPCWAESRYQCCAGE